MEALNRFNQDVHYEIENVGNKNEIPKTARRDAKKIYDEFITQEIAWSRPKRHFAIASIYFTCRDYGLPYTIRDLKNEDEELSKISKTFRKLCSEVGRLPEPHDPKAFVNKISDNMPIVQERVAERAREIIEITDNSKISGKQPNTIAASAFYLATMIENVNITQDMIGNAANVSAVAIRNTYRDLDKPE